MKSYLDFLSDFFDNWKGDEINKSISEIEVLFNFCRSQSEINYQLDDLLSKCLSGFKDLSDRVSVIEKKLKIKKGEKK